MIIFLFYDCNQLLHIIVLYTVQAMKRLKVGLSSRADWDGPLARHFCWTLWDGDGEREREREFPDFYSSQMFPDFYSSQISIVLYIVTNHISMVLTCSFQGSQLMFKPCLQPICDSYPLVNVYIAIENCHLVRWFSKNGWICQFVL